jgi:hypothetical protein
LDLSLDASNCLDLRHNSRNSAELSRTCRAAFREPTVSFRGARERLRLTTNEYSAGGGPTSLVCESISAEGRCSWSAFTASKKALSSSSPISLSSVLLSKIVHALVLARIREISRDNRKRPPGEESASASDRRGGLRTARAPPARPTFVPCF